jgi:uncharacterized repeat protein (TIGR03803 family)
MVSDNRGNWRQLFQGELAFILMLALGIIFNIQSMQAQTFTVLHQFAGRPDAAYPYEGLITDAKGNFYGTSYKGGAYGSGAVFKLSKSGVLTVLHSFDGSRDGGCPYSGLVRDATGNLYGTTAEGGTSGFGVVFKVSSGGKETVLHNFTGGVDGIAPFGGLVRNAAGNLYGTTELGGTSGHGTIFKIDAHGTESVLHSFNGSDGAYPTYTSLLLDKAGNLYGVTESGGTTNNGVLYVLHPDRNLTVLHNFRGGKKDGCFPVGTPVMDANGNLFGAAEQCGSSNQGILWKVSSSGSETVLHNFAGGSADGASPFGGVLLDDHRNLYGETLTGGAFRYGTLYMLSKTGKLKLLRSLGVNDGAYPIGGLIRGAGGDLYGTAVQGGTLNHGTAFRVTP